MPRKLCLEHQCPRPATWRGRCDIHRRKLERERSADRRGGYVNGPMVELTDARDADPGYRHPNTKRGAS